MFATLIPRLGPFAVTQSMPQMTCAQVPLPAEFSTLTAYMVVFGATPTTPDPVFLAAMVPAVTQFFPLTAFRSGCARLTPVSMTATDTVLAALALVVDAASMRRTPVGAVSPAASGTLPTASTVWSALTTATAGCVRTRASWDGVSRAAKPFNAS